MHLDSANECTQRSALKIWLDEIVDGLAVMIKHD